MSARNDTVTVNCYESVKTFQATLIPAALPRGVHVNMSQYCLKRHFLSLFYFLGITYSSYFLLPSTWDPRPSTWKNSLGIKACTVSFISEMNN